MPQNKPYRCGACSKTFASAEDLMTHLKICRAAIMGRAFLDSLTNAEKRRKRRTK